MMADCSAVEIFAEQHKAFEIDALSKSQVYKLIKAVKVGSKKAKTQAS
jgi:hypothetical protein